MAYTNLSSAALDYDTCQYGQSKLVFRGPKKSLDDPYLAFLGGAETYGKFIARPFPELVNDRLGINCLNLGCMNAGPDVFLDDPAVAMACENAASTAVQIVGAINQSNRFYTVHKRRNDRFVKALPELQELYPEVDFMDYNFTHHLVRDLHDFSPERFTIIREELQTQWLNKMERIMRSINGARILVWMSDHLPGEATEHIDITSDPACITRDMMDYISSFADDVVEIKSDRGITPAHTDEAVLDDREKDQAAQLLGVGAHCQAANAVSETILGLVE